MYFNIKKIKEKANYAQQTLH